MNPDPPFNLPPAHDDNKTLLIKMSTTLWGAFGTNGLLGTSKDHARQIGELYGKTEELSTQLERRLAGIYRLVATLTVTILVSAIGIIATLVLTRGA